MRNRQRMSNSLGKGFCLLVTLLVMAALSSLLLAQLPFDPLTANEKDLAIKTLMSDARTQQNLANNARYRVVNVERHEEDKAIAMTAERRADVVLYNYTTDEAFSAVVRLGNNPRVDAVHVSKGPQPALTEEEVDEAKQLAQADPAVVAKLKAAGLTDDAVKSLVITYLFAKSMNKDDACSAHRCVLLFFNTRDAVLDISPIVDLSAQKVHCN